MTRIAIIFIIVFLLLGVLFQFSRIENRNENIASNSTKATVPSSGTPKKVEGIEPYGIIVYASKNIEKGSEFSADSLELREVSQSLIPQDGITNESALFERRARENIAANQLVSIQDVNPDDLTKWTNFDELRERELVSERHKPGFGSVLYASTDIPSSHRIGAFSVTSRTIEKSKIPNDAAISYKGIFGRLPKFGLSQGEIILESNLVPR